jgi:dihydroorotate dehydrogenase (NAD+) catalytic subunit
MLKLDVDLAPRGKRPLSLKNPVMTASGTFSNGIEYARLIEIGRLGGIVSKGTTLRARRGNAQQRTAETPAGMLNSIGFQNIGVEALIRNVAPVWASWDVPVIVNILGDSVAEFVDLAGRLDGVAGVAGLELNISCPNLDVGGMEFGVDARLAAGVTAATRRATTLPLIVKLTPNVTDIVAIAEAVEQAGADALCTANTLLGMAIDARRRRPILNRGVGGLSGPAVKPIILRMVYQVAERVAIPIVASGGVGSGLDAVEFLLAGATAVQVGTATFRNPRAPLDVLDGIERFMQEEGVQDLHELIGAAHPVASTPHSWRDEDEQFETDARGSELDPLPSGR